MIQIRQSSQHRVIRLVQWSWIKESTLINNIRQRQNITEELKRSEAFSPTTCKNTPKTIIPSNSSSVQIIVSQWPDFTSIRVGRQYAAKGRELTQLHNSVARGNGLILCAQLFTSECFKCSVKFRDMTQHYRHYITMTTRFAFGCSHNVMWTRANCPVFPPKDRKERMVRRRMQGVCLPSC